MNIEQKPLEQVQAQVAVYASEQVHREDSTRQIDLLKNLGNISLPGVVPEYVEHPYPTVKKEYVGEDLVIVKNRGDPSVLFEKDGYLESIRKPGNRERTNALAEMIGAYPEFESTIKNLGIADLTLEEARLHPNFLSYGGSDVAFRFEHSEKPDEDGHSKTFVARYGQGGPERADRIEKANSKAISFAAAKGLPGLEQGIAISYDPPIVISEFADGKNLYGLSTDERRAIPAKHWQQLKDAIVGASGAGISIDANSDNFIYNPETGFTVLDYRLQSDKTTNEKNLADNVGGYEKIFKIVTGSDAITQN